MRKALTFLKWTAALVGALILGFCGFVELEARRTYEDTPVPHIEASQDPAVIERGKYVFHYVAHCSTCHLPREDVYGGAIGLGKAPAPRGGGLWDMPFGVLRSPNLTPDPDTGIADYSPGEIARVINTGVRKDGRLSVFMALGVGELAADDLVAVVSYLKSVEPVKNEVPESAPNFLGRAFVALLVDPAARKNAIQTAPNEPGVERGRYLVEGPALCRGCHTTHDMSAGFAEVGTPLGGGDVEPDEADPSMVIVAPNLTPGGFLRTVNEDSFVARLRAGRVHKSSKMPWEAFSGMSDDDLRSIHRYLSTLAPVEDDGLPSRRPAE